jgi:hypothetical protein
MCFVSSGSILRLLELGCELEDRRRDGPLVGFQNASLGVPETGEIAVGELREPLPERLEPRLDLRGGRPQGRPALLCRRGIRAARIPEQAFTGGGIGGHPVGLDEGQGVPGRQSVARGCGPEAHLATTIEGTEGARHGETKPAVLEETLEILVELLQQKQPSRDPGLLAPQELRDRREAQAVVLHERLDDVRLVHGAHAASGGIGGEHRRLHGDARDRLDDDRDLALALGAPACETLEPIDDLVVPAFDLGDPDRKLGEGRGTATRSAKPRQRRAQASDRHETDAHGLPPSRLKIW